MAARGPDARVDPQATQKISREELEEALRRTKSGTRQAVRSEPDFDVHGYAGPRDDSPQITIVRIDSMELEAIDPSTLPAPSAPTPGALTTTALLPRHTPSGTMPIIVTTPMDVAASLPRPTTGVHESGASAADAIPRTNDRASAARVIERSRALTQRLHVTPRMAFIAGIAVAALVALAALVGFFAGRGVPGVK